MRKKLVIFSLILCLFFGAVANAAASASAVRTLIQRGLTKTCGVAANDNRCLRLVSGGSDILSGALNVVAIMGGPKAWLFLLADYVIGAGMQYFFKTDDGEKITVEKDNNGILQVVEKETTGTSEPVPTITGDVGISTTNNYGSIGVDSLPIWNDGSGIDYSDPRTTIKSTKGVFTPQRFDDLWSNRYEFANTRFSSVKEAQKYYTADFYGSIDYKRDGYSTLLIYALDPASTADYWSWGYQQVTVSTWYFTNSDFKPLYVSNGSGTAREFVGYLSEIKYKVQGAAEYQLGFVLFSFVKTPYGTGCADDQYNSTSGCVSLVQKISELVGAEYATSSDVNQKASSILNTTSTEAVNQPFSEWIDQNLKNSNFEMPAEFVAEAVNKLYRETTSAEGYDGVPYNQINELTAQDVRNLASSMPSYSDAMQPIGDIIGNSGVKPGTNLTPDTSTGSLIEMPSTGTGGVKDPITNVSPNPAPGVIGGTGTGTSTGTITDGNLNVNVNTKVEVDLGSYPEIGEPTLEPPVASEILAPIFNLFPTLQNYQVPSHESECPRPSMDVFGKTYVLEIHCDLMEQNRAVIQSIFSVVWMFAALTVFLKA